MNLDQWCKKGLYLPEVIRDFHAQKELFKAIHNTISINNHSYARDIDWISGQCYVIDIFLWYMARRGYVLQRSRKQMDFRDLQHDIDLATRKTGLLEAIADD
jgi:hypothetical protein